MGVQDLSIHLPGALLAETAAGNKVCDISVCHKSSWAHIKDSNTNIILFWFLVNSWRQSDIHKHTAPSTGNIKPFLYLLHSKSAII